MISKSKFFFYKALSENLKFQWKAPDMYTCARKTLEEYCGSNLYNKTLLDFRSRVPVPQFNGVHLLVTINKPVWKVIIIIKQTIIPFLLLFKAGIQSGGFLYLQGYVFPLMYLVTIET